MIALLVAAQIYLRRSHSVAGGDGDSKAAHLSRAFFITL